MKKTSPGKLIKTCLKYISLIFVVIFCFYFIDNHKDGFNFGVIALVCWAFSFLDLARIKFKDYEIDFMSKKEVLTAEERELFQKCYDLITQFQSRVYENGCVDGKTMDLIWKARDYARLYLPDDLANYIQEIMDIAKNAHSYHILWETSKNQTDIKKYSDEKHKYEDQLFDLKPYEHFRKYLKVKVNAE